MRESAAIVNKWRVTEEKHPVLLLGFHTNVHTRAYTSALKYMQMYLNIHTYTMHVHTHINTHACMHEKSRGQLGQEHTVFPHPWPTCNLSPAHAICSVWNASFLGPTSHLVSSTLTKQILPNFRPNLSWLYPLSLYPDTSFFKGDTSWVRQGHKKALASQNQWLGASDLERREVWDPIMTWSN